MALIHRADFSGGISGRPAATLGPKELVDSRNLWWDGLLKPIAGWTQRKTSGLAGQVVGAVGIPGIGDAMLCVFNRAGRYVFRWLQGNSLISLGGASWTGSRAPVHMVHTDRGIVACSEIDGNWPIVIRETSGGWQEPVPLESLDTRRRALLERTISLTGVDNYQGTENSQVSADGKQTIGIESDYTFNTVRVGFVGSTGSTPTFDLLDAEGDAVNVASASHDIRAGIVKELVLRLEWENGDDDDDDDLGYAVQGNSGRLEGIVDLGASTDIRYVEIEHDQYLRQIMPSSPHMVELHNNRVFLAARNVTQLSPRNRLNGWNVSDQEYFQEGTGDITAMRSFGDMLAVFKQDAVFAIVGNSYKNWGKVKGHDGIGTKSPRSVVAEAGILFFEDSWGYPAVLVGRETEYAGRHIAQRLGNYAGATHRGNGGLILLHEDGGELAFWIDPDSLIRDDNTTDMRLSFFPFDLPGPLSFSWEGGVDRTPFIVVGSSIYEWDQNAVQTDVRASFSLYDGHSPEQSSVSRLSLDVEPAASVAAAVSMMRRDASGDWVIATFPDGTEITATTPAGIIHHSVPDIDNGVEVAELRLSGPAEVRSITYQTLQRAF